MENKIYGLGLTENYNESYIFYDGDLIEQIVTFVREKTAHEKIAIYGHRGSGRPLLAELEAKGLGGRMAAHYDLHHSRFDQFNKNPEIMVLNHDFSYLILCFYRKNYREKLRFLAKYIGQKCNIILPFAPEGCFDANKIEDPTPTVVFSFSCSGSNRVTPALEYLFQYFQRRTKGLDNLVRNTRYLYSVLEKGQNPSTEDIDSYYSQQIKYLDYYTWLYIHHPFSLKTLRDIKDIKIVVHMRDPRDIINSYYFRLYGDRSDNSEGFYIDGHCEEKKEERLLKMLEGGTFQKLNNYFLPWPSAKKMVDNYLEVQKH
ncbi:MAG: hypothetical protein GY757_47775, partial [bacterium]|nr:hypothetical protein [bacterium]